MSCSGFISKPGWEKWYLRGKYIVEVPDVQAMLCGGLACVHHMDGSKSVVSVSLTSIFIYSSLQLTWDYLRPEVQVLFPPVPLSYSIRFHFTEEQTTLAHNITVLQNVWTPIKGQLEILVLRWRKLMTWEQSSLSASTIFWWYTR